MDAPLSGPLAPALGPSDGGVGEAGGEQGKQGSGVLVRLCVLGFRCGGATAGWESGVRQRQSALPLSLEERFQGYEQGDW